MFQQTSFRSSLIFLTLISCRVFQPVFRYSLATRMHKIKLLLAGAFFRCSTVQLHWNKGSTGLLVLSQADVDKTNQSYYGETKLNYLTTDRAFEGIVPLSKFLLLRFDKIFPLISGL